MSIRIGGANAFLGSGSRCDAMMLAIEYGFVVVANDR